MNLKGSVLQSSRFASTTSRCPIMSTGLCSPLPFMRTTRFCLRSFGPNSCISEAANPPARRRLAMASAAAVTLPTESVVLISMSSLNTSRARALTAESVWGGAAAAAAETSTASESASERLRMGLSFCERADEGAAGYRSERAVDKAPACWKQMPLGGASGLDQRLPDRNQREFRLVADAQLLF